MATNSTVTSAILPHPSVDDAWLAQQQEAVLDPDLPIIDPHHHLWDRPNWRYLLPEITADLAGHNVVATVFVQCGAMYRTDGPVEMQPVGEVEFANAIAEASAGGSTAVCAGIVGHADLMLGDRVEGVLEALIAAAPARMRGIRHITAWHPDPAVKATIYNPFERQMFDDTFRAGFACLGRLNLSYDAFVYHTQIDDVAQLADAFPDTPIVMNHVGGVVGIGPYEGKRAEVLAAWRRDVRVLAERPNVTMKIGGLAMRLPGFGFNEMPSPPSSEYLADAWRPYVDTCIDAFGPTRCMFESNFPVDKASTGYIALWNAFKRLAAACSAGDKAALFSGTAARVYRLEPTLAR